MVPKKVRGEVVISVLILLLYYTNTPLRAQLTGTIQDSQARMLEAVNVLGGINHSSATDCFVFSNSDGYFRLDCPVRYGDTLYVQVRALGFRLLRDTLFIDQHRIERNYSLEPQTDQLATFTLSEPPPSVIVRGDSTIYNVSGFASGREQDLRELIAKLPGLEIGSDDVVLFRGRPVDRITVENEGFFGGSTGMALDRLPADAVGKIEVTENHHDVPFLRGRTDEDELLLNVALRTEKKNVWFGRSEALANPSSSYAARGDAFKFSSRVKATLIADANTINRPALTMADLLRMGGQGLELEHLSQQLTAFFPYLENRQRVAYRAELGAFNWSLAPTERWKLSGNLVATRVRDRQLLENTNVYRLPGEDAFEERRRTSSAHRQPLVRGQATLELPANRRRHLRIGVGGLYRTVDNRREVRTTTITTQSARQAGRDLQAQLDAHLVYDHRYRNDVTGTFEAEFSYSRSTPDLLLQATDTLLNPLLYSVAETLTRVEQDDNASVYRSGWRYRYLLPLAKKNTLEFNARQQFVGTYRNYLTRATDERGQPLPDMPSGDARAKWAAQRVSASYRLQANALQAAVTLEAAWLRDRTDRVPPQQRLIPLPSFSLRYNWPGVAEITAKAARAVGPADPATLVEGYRVTDFNRVYGGLPRLASILRNNYQLRLVRSNLLRGYTWHLDGSHLHIERGLVESYEGQGVVRRVRPTVERDPQRTWRGRLAVNWTTGPWRWTPSLRVLATREKQLVNNSFVRRKTASFLIGGRVGKTGGKRGEGSVDMGIGYRRLRQGGIMQPALFYECSVKGNYRLWKAWQLDTVLELFAQRIPGERFQHYPDWELSLTYRPAERPFHLRATAINLVGTSFVENFIVGDLYVSRNRQFLFPRTLVIGGGWRF